MSKILFKITTEDVQYVAQNRIQRKLTSDELYSIKKDLEFGFEDWHETVAAAIKMRMGH